MSWCILASKVHSCSSLDLRIWTFAPPSETLSALCISYDNYRPLLPFFSVCCLRKHNTYLFRSVESQSIFFLLSPRLSSDNRVDAENSAATVAPETRKHLAQSSSAHQDSDGGCLLAGFSVPISPLSLSLSLRFSLCIYVWVCVLTYGIKINIKPASRTQTAATAALRRTDDFG